jgi:hypothetical protein
MLMGPMQASAVMGLAAGTIADWLRLACSWPLPRVRALMQTVATLGEQRPSQLCVNALSLSVCSLQVTCW